MLNCTNKFAWPPHIPEMGDVVKSYIDSGKALSIADRSGIYEELENEFARLHDRRYALLVSSGTMALYSAYFALGLEPGDEVISTVYTYHATATPLLHFGVHIVFCDVESDTGNIDISQIESIITPKTKAIVSNDQWGHPVDKEAITQICKKYGLRYIEDCSHAHFAQYKGRYVGTFGDVACWSFQGNKLLSGGEGGILLTDDKNIYEQAVLLGHNLKRPYQCVKNRLYADILRTGYGLKLRMHPLSAVMILHQLKNYCFDWIETRRKRLEYFQKSLIESTPIMAMARREYVTSMGAWYGFKPRCAFEKLGITKTQLIEYMQARGTEVKVPGSAPLNSLAIFANRFNIANFGEGKNQKDLFPGAQSYYNSILSLPTYTFEEDNEKIDRTVAAFVDFFRDINGG